MAALWTHPSPHLTRLDAFWRRISNKYDIITLKYYFALHQWTVENVEIFYRELWAFGGLIMSRSPSCVAESLINMWPRPGWFPGAELNFTENIFATGLAAHSDAIAVSACREVATEWRHLTRTRLRDEVAKYASGLANAGVGRGDRVADIQMPHCSFKQVSTFLVVRARAS